MRKRLEPALAVVAAHAAFAHAAERHLARCQVDDDVVDAAAAELQLVREAVDVPLIAREQIRGKRLRFAFEALRHLAKRLKRKNGQNRPENFFPHNRVARHNAVHNRGRDAAALGVTRAAVHHFALVNKPAQALEVLLVHDFAVVGILERRCAELAFNLLYQLSDEFIVHVALHEHVIGRHARLAAV